MKNILSALIFFLYFNVSFTQILKTPLEVNNYSKLSSYDDIRLFLENICKSTKLFKLDYIGTSTAGRKIPVLFISDSKFGKDASKIKVLIFAQQHGNEHSGKEGILLLLKKFAEKKFDYLLKKIDLLLIPQMNPDGSEKNERRNSDQIDLNRNHLILTAPETRALHRLFQIHLPEVVLDVHEYFPYSKEWLDFGYIKNFDEQFGCLSNLNVSIKIREFSKEKFIPFIKNYLNRADFSFSEYIVGSMVENDRIRHSTVDINDGRQSFGILNTFSFILEGKHGKDSIDNIKHRSEGQLIAIEGFLEFVNNNCNDISKLVHNERKKLINSSQSETVVIQMEHYKSDKPLNLSLLSLKTNQDTVITVNSYQPVVKPLLEVQKPMGYLIPKNDHKLKNFLDRQNIVYKESLPTDYKIIQGCKLKKIDSVYLEEMVNYSPEIEIIDMKDSINAHEYYFVPINQISSNLLVLSFELKSMFGLKNYDEFKYLLEINKIFPILRILK